MQKMPPSSLPPIPGSDCFLSCEKTLSDDFGNKAETAKRVKKA